MPSARRRGQRPRPPRAVGRAIDGWRSAVGRTRSRGRALPPPQPPPRPQHLLEAAAGAWRSPPPRGKARAPPPSAAPCFPTGRPAKSDPRARPPPVPKAAGSKAGPRPLLLTPPGHGATPPSPNSACAAACMRVITASLRFCAVIYGSTCWAWRPEMWWCVSGG